MAAPPKPVLLVISQVYVPDPASVGQHMADAAAEMARRGCRVVVLTSRRGYDDPRRRYQKRELRDGVQVRRLPLSSFGKSSILVRLLGGIAFVLQVIVRGLVMPRLAGLLVSTSPPMCSLAALVISAVRRVPFTYWAMDVNPDQVIALGKVPPGSLMVRLLDVLNRTILRRAARVVTLDRFMAERLQRKHELADRLSVMPPWPHEDALEVVEHAANPFRREHGLEGKFVLMYSGNMGFSTPLETILQATLRLQRHPDLMFLFIGGGVGKQDVEDLIRRHNPPNVRLLPYQPLEQIRFSLPAADVHLVSIGNDVVGIVHPCKIYGAMACARPSLLVGPRVSHAGELIERLQIGWQVDQGDVDRTVATIEKILQTEPGELREMGRRARRAVDAELGKRALCGRFCDVIEESMQAKAGKKKQTAQ